ncbi:hypothetical protein [Leptothoe kymatousa]|uniref:DUF11 domain-containing protein n=1 Tax=Leptothoe kymatousa TAU-MAC 1615 TaxID=2364775 RepID=A0ABS5Y0C1_9CYAN|nr:hypothetical protein [Leptothoe kymatousa]MBT9311287.1 hypothetical protein [Leptothoe kymatousa TAU-MAC 1615]
MTAVATPVIYISDEVGFNNKGSRNQVESLDDPWRSAASAIGAATITQNQIPTGDDVSISADNYELFTTSSGITVSTSLHNVTNAELSNPNSVGTVANSAQLRDSNTLQSDAPRPHSLYNTTAQPRYWNETSGSTTSRNGVLFTFSEPVTAFGAWFGDLETNPNGTSAIVRLLDADGNRIGDDTVVTTTTDPSQCGDASFRGCGNRTTRWIGFVDEANQVKQMLVVVGDDDPGDTGNREHISFIGATLAEQPADNPPKTPNLLLVKRITAINGDTETVNGNNLSLYRDDFSNPYDDNDITVSAPIRPTDPREDTDQWPNITTNLIGGIEGGQVSPSDEIEYTIYFLSSGNAAAEDVIFCDYIPTFSSFIPNAYGNALAAPGGIVGADLSVELLRNGSIDYHTGANDGDRATYFAPGIDPAHSFPEIDCDNDGNGINSNPNGAIVVILEDLPNASLDPTGAYGYVRFRTRIN